MRIEIFVVKTKIEQIQKPYWEHEAYRQLRKAKQALIELFGGFTEIKNTKGYWRNRKGAIEKDKVEIWLIYTDLDKLTFETDLKAILTYIKDATEQRWQAYTINDKIYYV